LSARNEASLVEFVPDDDALGDEDFGSKQIDGNPAKRGRKKGFKVDKSKRGADAPPLGRPPTKPYSLARMDDSTVLDKGLQDIKLKASSVQLSEARKVSQEQQRKERAEFESREMNLNGMHQMQQAFVVMNRRTQEGLATQALKDEKREKNEERDQLLVAKREALGLSRKDYEKNLSADDKKILKWFEKGLT